VCSSDLHVLVASTYSKSVLRVAAQEVGARYADVAYFPAYEIVTGSQAPESFFDETRREVTPAAVDTVMAAFFAHCTPSLDGAAARSAAPDSSAEDRRLSLSRGLVEAECEEAMADRG
jgi:hypothetical protein